MRHQLSDTVNHESIFSGVHFWQTASLLLKRILNKLFQVLILLRTFLYLVYQIEHQLLLSFSVLLQLFQFVGLLSQWAMVYSREITLAIVIGRCIGRYPFCRTPVWSVWQLNGCTAGMIPSASLRLPSCCISHSWGIVIFLLLYVI